MATTTTLETLRLTRLALYQLRQDIGVPETVAAAAADTSTLWTKCKELFDVAFYEVLSAHNWTWKRSAAASDLIDTTPDNWPEDAKNALIYSIARELAVPVAGRVEDMKNCHSLYQEKLRVARIHDLEGEIAAISDTDQKEVFAAVCPSMMSGDNSLPMDLLTISRRIEANAAHARAEILLAHNWSFAREELAVGSCSCDATESGYPFHTELPQNCARVLECYTHGGDPADWKLVGTVLRSTEPISSVIFLRDETRLNRWPPLLRDAYCALLAADISATVSGSSTEANRLREIYERKLANAKLYDSRSSGAKREVYGRNHYADAMRGRIPGNHALGGRIWRY